jgi:hypothetical protein
VPQATIASAAQTLSPLANTPIADLSPLQRAELLIAIQKNPAIAEMVKVGLLKWSDLIDTSGDKPTLKMEYLAKISREISALSQAQASMDLRAVQFRRQQKVAGGFQASSGGPFGDNVKVYRGPQYIPGSIPDPQNSVSY